MNKITFNKGIKTYQINDDENAVISFSTSDFKILDRAEEVQKNITAKLGEFDKKQNEEGQSSDIIQKLLNDCDKYIREQINYLFNSDVADTVFDNMNCVSIVDGEPVCVNFLKAVVPIIEKDLSAVSSSANVQKYTKSKRR